MNSTKYKSDIKHNKIFITIFKYKIINFVKLGTAVYHDVL